MKDTLTVALEGDTISLEKFAAALRTTLRMVTALAGEVAHNSSPIEWVIDGLDRGSAVATIRGLAAPGEEESVELVVAAFGDVARAMESGERITRARAVVNQARQFEKLLGEDVTEIRIETPDRDATIRQQDRLAVLVAPQARQNYGAIRGRIQTLSNRGSLRFTLYDTIYDKAVSCYLGDAQQELVRGLWGQIAVVEGLVRRDPQGKPVTIREITAIVPLREPEPGRWREAFGAVPISPGGESAEATIRRLRDA
jgi:hypothetical protein